MVSVAAIVVAIDVYLIFSQVWDGAERVLSVLGGVFSALAGYASAFSAYVTMPWAPDQVVPTVLLRDAIATTSAAGNAATYLAREIESWQRHPLATADDTALFSAMAVPTTQMAEMENGIEKLQKKLDEDIRKELARLYRIRAAMEHIIHELARQNNMGSQGRTSETTEQRIPSQKEKKYRGW